MFAGLQYKEGVGDNVTSVQTGALGVTQAAREAVGASPGMSDQAVAQAYLGKLSRTWATRPGFSEAPPVVQEALLDMSYNVGEGAARYPQLNRALRQGRYEDVLKATLDTATVEGKSVRGIAKRRAENYNKVFPQSPITMVEQMDDGTIVYHKADGEYFTYKAKGGTHEKSTVGTLLVD